MGFTYVDVMNYEICFVVVCLDDDCLIECLFCYFCFCCCCY